MEKSTLPAASQHGPWISDGGRSHFEHCYTFYYSPKVENLFEKLLKLWLSGKSGNETAQTIQKLTLSINV